MAGRVKTPRKSRRANGTGRRATVEPGNLGALDYKRIKLKEIREDIQRCRDESKLTALSQLHRLEVQMHDEITIALDGQADPIVGMDADQLVDFITAAILDLPPVLQDSIANTVAAMRSGRVVTLETPPPKRKATRKKPATKKRATRTRKA